MTMRNRRAHGAAAGAWSEIAFAQGLTYAGTAGNDQFTGTGDDDTFNMYQGGDDFVIALGGDDVVNFGAALTGADTVDGGDGYDRVTVNGLAPISLTSAQIRNVEELVVGSGHAYDITLDADFRQAGEVFNLSFFNGDQGTSSIRFDGSQTDATLTVTGSDGNDVLIGGTAGDTFYMYQGGDDIVRGLAGDDHINFDRTFTVRDFVDGGDGYDVLGLDGGDTTVTLSSRNLEDVEQLALGSGHTYHITIAANLLRADQTFSIYSYVYTAGPTSVTIDGSATAATLNMSDSAGDDTLIGGSNDDFISVYGGGNDTLVGNGGNDIVSFDRQLTAGDTVDGGDGYDVVTARGDLKITLDSSVLKNVEELDIVQGHTYDLTIAANLLKAGQTFVVFNFYLDGDSDDTAIHINGAKTKGNLTLYGSSGDDVLIGGSGDDYFRTGGGTDTITGGAGFDRISYYTSTVGIVVDLNVKTAQDTHNGILKVSGVEAISGTLFADTITGDKANNLFFANGGADQLFGNDGDDYAIVGADVNHVLPTGVLISGGAGHDVVDFFNNGGALGAVTVDLGITTEQDVGQGRVTLSAVENIGGTQFGDTLTGSGDANVLAGADGGDTLHGGAGDDMLYGDGQFSFSGGNAAAPFVGDYGYIGNDVMIGGSGADTLTGGLGADVFVYQALSDSTAKSADTIVDFAHGIDRIDLSAIDADTKTPGDQAFHLGKTGGHVGDIVLTYDAKADVTTMSLFVDANKTVDATIFLAGNHTDLTAVDFVF